MNTNIYINENSPASWEYGTVVWEILTRLPDSAQVDMMHFMWGNGQ